MPLPESLARVPYVPIGDRRFKTTGTTVVDLPYFIWPAKCSRECESHPRVEVISTKRGSGARLIIRTGFVWNGASGPTWDSESIRRSALVHDALYGLMASGDLSLEWRKTADKCFAHLLRMGGVNLVRRWYYYAAVRMFGKRAASPQ